MLWHTYPFSSSRSSKVIYWVTSSNRFRLSPSPRLSLRPSPGPLDFFVTTWIWSRVIWGHLKSYFYITKYMFPCVLMRKHEGVWIYAPTFFVRILFTKNHMVVWGRWPDFRCQQFSQGLKKWFPRIRLVTNNIPVFLRSSRSIRTRRGGVPASPPPLHITLCEEQHTGER